MSSQAQGDHHHHHRHNHNPRYHERKPEGMLPVSMLEELSADPASAVKKKKTRLHLALSPGALGGLKKGLEVAMMENLNRYYPDLGAILLGWRGLKLCDRSGDIAGDSPYIHVNVEGWVYLFNPEVGSKILGKVIKKTAGHIGCLVHETFNVSLLCDKRQFNTIQLNELVAIRVNNLVWDNRRRLLLQGRLDSETEPDYDSGIDSTITGQADTEQEQDPQGSQPKTEGESESTAETQTKHKKSKKRKREADESSQAPSHELEISGAESHTPAKKKKKKKKESE